MKELRGQPEEQELAADLLARYVDFGTGSPFAQPGDLQSFYDAVCTVMAQPELLGAEYQAYFANLVVQILACGVPLELRASIAGANKILARLGGKPGQPNQTGY